MARLDRLVPRPGPWPLIRLLLFLILPVLFPNPWALAQEANAFRFDSQPIPASLARRMTGVSHRSCCPVPIADLAYIRLTHWGMDGLVHSGELVVHGQVVSDLRSIFAELFAARFPIEKMRLIDEYQGDDDRSMADDNTSAFNCRAVPGSRNWSRHAYGLALDINPLINPYLTPGRVSPPGGEAFLDRKKNHPGLIVPGDACHQAFTRRGWRWGGDWKNSKDYQHFDRSLPGGIPKAAQPPDQCP
jgi:hypothetical protein